MKYRDYDKTPVVELPDAGDACVSGWDAIATRLRAAIAARNPSRTVLTVECYTGIDVDRVRTELARRIEATLVIDAREAYLPSESINALVSPYLGGDDPVFGFLSPLSLPRWFDEARVNAIRRQICELHEGVVLVVGCGSWHLFPGEILVYADLSRWEGQNRFRRNEVSNLGIENLSAPAHLQYKRAFFVDWRVCDRWKKQLIDRWDFLLDTHDAQTPKLADAEAVRQGLRHAVTRPFRVVPFFDPAPWGGQWMKEVCNLERDVINYGWCFDCVPEENSLLLQLGNTRIELPSLNVVFYQPRHLLGDAVHARFGDEFPIRFDFLDTMGGGNLSFQVHPLTEYIQQHFGMHYTQDESYYILDAGANASVYLGLKEGIDRQAMRRELEEAQIGMRSFAAEQYVNRWPAKKHDHFLIPAGTCHCSGAESMVLEISATPYIFTFKMWDWGRLGLDGTPRPVHLEHGLANVQWDRTTDWVQRELINRVRPVAAGKHWREEQTGLHEREFIETRRHWFSDVVTHETGGSVNVLNLVEGDEAIIESPEGRFRPFLVHYAETFIVPANVGTYTIRPGKATPDQPHATIKAYVRHRG